MGCLDDMLTNEYKTFRLQIKGMPHQQIDVALRESTFFVALEVQTMNKKLWKKIREILTQKSTWTKARIYTFILVFCIQTVICRRQT